MTCDRYFELLSARLDRELTREEAEEVELHRAGCGRCRILGSQLEELRETFASLEDVEAPEGFAQGVMERVRVVESEKKVIPLFKRPQVRALAGLAACLVLVAGLYGASRPRNLDKGEIMDVTVRGFIRDAASGELEDAPQIAAYAAPEDNEMQKAAPNPAADGLSSDWADAEVTLILDRLPQGAEEVLPPDAAVIYDEEAGGDVYTWLTTEELAAIEKLAFEQGMIAGTTEIFPSPTGARCALIVRRG
ncbi:MAG: hypothetical protein HFF58_07025 [Lawsonibacter sp.]|jgi:hypothetical protein|nr:hypothetical protein [Lawsonibacter sp.]